MVEFQRTALPPNERLCIVVTKAGACDDSAVEATQSGPLYGLETKPVMGHPRGGSRVSPAAVKP